MNNAVFSDLDGTLSKGFITADFVRYLNTRGVINKEAYQKHEDLLKAHHEGKIAYIDLVPRWAQSVAACFKGHSVKELQGHADVFFPEWKKKNLYPSSKPLVALFHEHHYKIFLISAGWDYTLGLVAHELGADDVRGIVFEVEKGVYTGVTKSTMPTKEGKVSAIRELSSTYEIDPKKTIGMGDSVQDTAIFDTVKKAVALNPSQELEMLAKERKWFIATKENILDVMQDCFARKKV